MNVELIQMKMYYIMNNKEHLWINFVDFFVFDFYCIVNKSFKNEKNCLFYDF